MTDDKPPFALSKRDKCVIYLRVSSKAQAEDDRDGYPRQRQLLHEYADRNGLYVVAEFQDALTGATSGEDREGWSALIRFLHEDGVTVILVEKLDRLARDLMTQEVIIADLQKNGFTLKSLSDPDLCSSDPTRVLMRQILGAFAQYERALISSRTHRKGSAHRPGQKPFGELAGEEVVLGRMKELRDSGLTFMQVAVALNTERHRPRGRVRGGKQQGAEWTETGVAKILRRAQ
jgi:DNA invertase Pin-like site-specific DNA recombinase